MASILDYGAGASEGLDQMLARMLLEAKFEEQKRATGEEEKFRRSSLEETSALRRSQQEMTQTNQEALRSQAARDDVRLRYAMTPKGNVISPEQHGADIKTGGISEDFFLRSARPDNEAVAAGVPPALAQNDPDPQDADFIFQGTAQQQIAEENAKLRERGVANAEGRVDRGWAPLIIQQPSGLFVTDSSRSSISPLQAPGGNAPLPMTAEMRNRQETVKGLFPFMNQLKGMSDSIITRVGPAQRADAVKRGVEAVFGTDPDFKSYQDFRNSLAVMIAVASQGARPSDADVFRAALPMVPNPYADTSESAKQKWDLITTMFRSRLSPEMQQEMGLSPADTGAGATRRRVFDPATGTLK